VTKEVYEFTVRVGKTYPDVQL